MRLLSTLSSLLAISLCSAKSFFSNDHTLSIYYQPLTPGSSKALLATFDTSPLPASNSETPLDPLPSAYRLTKWYPPSDAKSLPANTPVRITATLPPSDTQLLSSTLTTIGLLRDSLGGFDILIHPTSQEIVSVSFMRYPRSPATAQKMSAAETGTLIPVSRVIPGATPVLNKPVVLDPTGKVPQMAEEKSFFQKYWWIGLAVMFLAILGSGDSK
jgi:hypothetical protein